MIVISSDKEMVIKKIKDIYAANPFFNLCEMEIEDIEFGGVVLGLSIDGEKHTNHSHNAHGGAIAAFAALCPIAGIPTNQILGVYISVNTLCDMGATCVNVIGDLACSTVLKQTLHFDKKK